MHVLGTGVPRCLGVARSASSPKAAQALGCTLTPGLRISFGRSPAWHGLPQCPGYGRWVSYCCVALVFGSGLCGRPATPGWGLGWVCLGSVCAVGLGFWLALRHSWLASWGMHGCVHAPPYPAVRVSGVRCGCVCLGWRFGCTPQLLAGVLGCVCICVRAPLVPRHSWLGCVVWMCVLGLRFWLRPASPGWGVGVCVCLSARSACTPPLLAGVCGVGVCARAGVWAAPRHPWLGCWVVCVVVRALRLYPATSGWGARWLCVLGRGFRLRPAAPGWGVGVCVCLCACSACTSPLLAELCGLGVCA